MRSVIQMIYCFSQFYCDFVLFCTCVLTLVCNRRIINGVWWWWWWWWSRCILEATHYKLVVNAHHKPSIKTEMSIRRALCSGRASHGIMLFVLCRRIWHQIPSFTTWTLALIKRVAPFSSVVNLLAPTKLMVEQIFALLMQHTRPLHYVRWREITGSAFLAYPVYTCGNGVNRVNTVVEIIVDNTLKCITFVREITLTHMFACIANAICGVVRYC